MAFVIIVAFLISISYASLFDEGQFGRGLFGKTGDIVTFSMEFSINGAGGDTPDADGSGAGYYTGATMANYYGCVQDATITGTPAFGIVSGNGRMEVLNISTGNSYKIEMSQKTGGNDLLIAATNNGCSSIQNKFSFIKTLGHLPSAFVGFDDGRKQLEIFLPFSDIDLLGDFSKTGAFKINLEKCCHV